MILYYTGHILYYSGESCRPVVAQMVEYNFNAHLVSSLSSLELLFVIQTNMPFAILNEYDYT